MFSMKHVDLSHAEAVELYPLRDQRDVQARYLQSLVRFTEARLRSWARDDVYDDMFQEAMLGALCALEAWNPTLSRWFNHGARAVRRAVYRAPLKEQAQRKGVPFNAYLLSKYGGIKATMPEEPVYLEPANDDSPGMEPASDMPVIRDSVESILSLSNRYVQDSGRLHAYIERVIINDESSNAFAREHRVTRQALHQTWIKCKLELQQAY